MYICKECGCEYKTKPDFCECGNDTFDVRYETTPKDKPEKEHREYKTADIISWLVFLLCLLFSVLILLFFPKIEDKPVKHDVKIQKPVPQNIPDINLIWKDAQPVVEEQPIKPIEIIKETIFKPKQEAPVKKVTPAKTVKKQQVPLTQQQKPQQKTQQQAKPVTKVQQTKPAQNVKVQTTQKPTQVRTRSLDYEMLNYRSALRMQLLSNLKLAEIEGSGSCGIEFAVDSTGKLINRGFTFQSDNTTINDAVYAMLMRTPKYNPPPSTYDGRKIKMVFKLGNGSYEVSFVD